MFVCLPTDCLGNILTELVGTVKHSGGASVLVSCLTLLDNDKETRGHGNHVKQAQYHIFVTAISCVGESVLQFPYFSVALKMPRSLTALSN